MVNDPAAAPPPPFFILSTPRSGSTLMRYIVDTHPEVACPSELNLGVLCDDLYMVVALTLGQTLPDPPGSAANERAVLAEVRRIVDG
ncbi:MAG: sulfotransferase, partial [Acidobacteria bacterium]|nr:sulfotransferase [Acidobacteriota bacterium]